MLSKTLEEIREIPKFAEICFDKNKGIKLPRDVYYLGMGASFTPMLAPYYAGAMLKPELASEYASYLSNNGRKALGVLVSQSGKSMETVACAQYFEEYTAITNDPDSALAKGKNLKDVFLLYAGGETSISSKTYINTLINLYSGFGFKIDNEVGRLKKDLK